MSATAWGGWASMSELEFSRALTHISSLLLLQFAALVGTGQRQSALERVAATSRRHTTSTTTPGKSANSVSSNTISCIIQMSIGAMHTEP